MIFLACLWTRVKPHFKCLQQSSVAIYIPAYHGQWSFQGPTDLSQSPRSLSMSPLTERLSAVFRCKDFRQQQICLDDDFWSFCHMQPLMLEKLCLRLAKVPKNTRAKSWLNGRIETPPSMRTKVFSCLAIGLRRRPSVQMADLTTETACDSCATSRPAWQHVHHLDCRAYRTQAPCSALWPVNSTHDVCIHDRCIPMNQLIVRKLLKDGAELPPDMRMLCVMAGHCGWCSLVAGSGDFTFLKSRPHHAHCVCANNARADIVLSTSEWGFKV